MYFTPTICIAQLLVALQVLMTLVMPLRTTTTSALPVTSKPIESTAEKLAWQAWIMLPPEQKQLIKSRKVTPKSIFTLPLRVECPEGHQQVDMKCIPTVIGSNAVLIDPNVLGLVVGDGPIDVEYDYEDDVGDKQPQVPYNTPLYMNDPLGTGKSKDEPLKFNIFQTKFPTDEYPMEDYSSMSNEGVLVVDSDQSNTNTINLTVSESFNSTVNVTTETDLISEATNVSKSHTLTTLPDNSDFNLDDLDALSLPASSSHEQKSHKISLFKEDASIHLVTSPMDTESTMGDRETLETLLQTESLMPMLNHTTAATVMPAESLTLTTASLSSTSDDLSLNVDEEEMTTLPNLMDRNYMDSMVKEDNAEFIRSITMNSLYSASDEGDDDEATTLTPSTSDDEPAESAETTTTASTIQLDDTTIIENNEEDSSSTTTSITATATPTPTTTELYSLSSEATTPLGEELKELLLQQEQALKDFEELQRMRKGETDQHTVMKKSKVEPVEVLSASATTSVAAKTMPSETPAATATTEMDELITAETVTPLLTVHNNERDKNDRNNNNNNNIKNNNNNDRFYYQHFAKQDLESAAVSGGGRGASQQQTSPKATTQTPAETTTTPTTTATAATETLVTTTATSEINLAEELRLINELVKGKRPAAATTAASSSSATSTTDDASTSPSPSPSPSPSSSESSASSIKSTLETTQLWSKIMPLLNTTPKTSTTTTTATAPQSESSAKSSTAGETSSPSTEIFSTTPVSSLVTDRSHRNSKIIRIHGLNTPNSITNIPTSPTTTEDIFTTITTEEESSASSASPEDGAYEPFWWLPVAWRLDKPTTTTKKPEQEQNSEEMPLLLRFWSTYHAPKSS